ncbi:MAG: CoA pyrophosphatase [Roseiarcus sp.]|uniref:CoA pyrophosphatase n=1 Tax=Roseiarcus sp. TaxID=1969460 RepID=UPI003C26EE68
MSDSPSPSALTVDGLRRLARARLAAEPAADAYSSLLARRGDHALDGLTIDPQTVAAARPAAVLAPIIPRPQGLTVLLTLRAAHLRSHSGQVAFPGGKIDAGETPAETALREAREEIGLASSLVEPLGWLDPYLTGTGYRVTALVALIDPAFAPTLNPDEVADAFETPFAFLMDAANHRLEERQWRGRTRKFYAMPYGERYIWGVTAGILRNLYERLFT